jgi:hypothetical protein
MRGLDGAVIASIPRHLVAVGLCGTGAGAFARVMNGVGSHVLKHGCGGSGSPELISITLILLRQDKVLEIGGELGRGGSVEGRFIEPFKLGSSRWIGPVGKTWIHDNNPHYKY